MRDFSKISPAVWQSKRFNSLPSDDGRYLYLYLLTNEHQTSAGCYRLPDGYAINDLRWELSRYVKARQELVAADLILFDATESVVMITRWFKHNAPQNESHFVGVERLLQRIPSHMIWDAASNAVNESWEAVQAVKLAKAIKYGKALPSASNGLQGGLPSKALVNLIGRGRQ
jgi:hypothetical protein